MGMFNILPAHAGTRFRDDYGAVPAVNAAHLAPLVQPSQVVAQGEQKHVA